jgi:hypothetical protein
VAAAFAGVNFQGLLDAESLRTCLGFIALNGSGEGPLFNRHGLRQIAGLIDIASATDSDVIGQQLARNNFKDR